MGFSRHVFEHNAVMASSILTGAADGKFIFGSPAGVKHIHRQKSRMFCRIQQLLYIYWEIEFLRGCIYVYDVYVYY
jgi:hypothetical protein